MKYSNENFGGAIHLIIIKISSKPGYKIIHILFKYSKCNILFIPFDFGIKCDLGPRHEPKKACFHEIDQSPVSSAEVVECVSQSVSMWQGFVPTSRAARYSLMKSL